MLNPSPGDDFPLNPFQRRAVLNVHAQAVVTGGPGTGRTYVLEARVRELLKQGADPRHISVLTVNPQSASRLRRRLEEQNLIREAPDGIFVGTVDQFANLLVRLFAECGLGAPVNYSIWDGNQAQSVAALSARGAPSLKTLRAKVRPALRWNRTRRQRSSDDVALPVPDADWCNIVEFYERAKEEHHALDVEDLAVFAVLGLQWLQNRLPARGLPDEGIEEHESIRSGLRDWVRHRCRHLLIDQAEDMYPRQAEMVKLLANPKGSLLVAVDPNQRVEDPDFEWVDHSWRWRVGQTQLHELTVSYRGTEPLSSLTDVLKLNSNVAGLASDGQRPHRAHGPTPRLVEVSGTMHSVVGRCLDDVQRLHDQGVAWEDIAVVYRKRAALRRAKTPLLHRDIPYQALEEERLRRPTDARWIVAMLSVALNPYDLEALRVAAAPGHPNRYRQLPVGLAEKMLQAAREQGVHLIDAANYVADDPKVPHRNHLEELVLHWQTINQWLDEDRVNLLELMEHTGGLVRRQWGVADNEPEKEWLRNSCIATPTLPDECLRDQLRRFLDKVSPALGSPVEYDAGSGVTFSTMRAAKGREWPVVMILDVSDGTIPGEAGGERLRREQRLLFSALTRSTQQLHLYVQADTGQGNDPKLCRFLEPVRHLLARETVDYRPRVTEV